VSRARRARARALLTLHLEMLRRLLIRDPPSGTVPHPVTRAREPAAVAAAVRPALAAEPEEDTAEDDTPEDAAEDRADDLACLL